VENVAYIFKRLDFAKFSPVRFFIFRGDKTPYGCLPVATAKMTQR
jgi:hypothetical protein